MWVYGDQTRTAPAAELLAEVQADLAAGDSLSALIGLGQLLQGVADAEFDVRGRDARSPATDALMTALVGVARRLPSPPEGEGPGMGGGAAEPRSSRPAAGVRLLPPIPTLPPPGGKGFSVRVPEGYAFYALHPALYAAAARQLPPADWRVIGIRSIGTSLAAVVAATLGAPPPVTVRPAGHPFSRELRLAPELEAEWAAHPGPFVVADEGPGLSGSSFGAVADTLERLGVARARIAFLPGHGGDLGPQASAEHRARWAGALRAVARFEDVVLPRLAASVEGLVGPGTAPLRDISGGGWRALRVWPEPPPISAAQERRKFLHATADGAWLVKFAGSGRIGRSKLDRARALYAAGFTPEPAGMVEGFLVQRWIDAPAPATAPRDRLADYLALRARFPAEPEAGAPLATLAEMIRVNAEEALGPAVAEAVRPWAEQAVRLEPRVRRVHTDGRLHRWEWLALADGRLLKADALDHSAAHDLVGAQDITWDVAGAELEHDLDEDGVERLRLHLDADPGLLDFMRLAYPAFQLGLWTVAAQAQAGWPEEAARAQAQADRYARRLAGLLQLDLTLHPPLPIVPRWRR